MLRNHSRLSAVWNAIPRKSMEQSKWIKGLSIYAIAHASTRRNFQLLCSISPTEPLFPQHRQKAHISLRFAPSEKTTASYNPILVSSSCFGVHCVRRIKALSKQESVWSLFRAPPTIRVCMHRDCDSGLSLFEN